MGLRGIPAGSGDNEACSASVDLACVGGVAGFPAPSGEEHTEIHFTGGGCIRVAVPVAQVRADWVGSEVEGNEGDG